MSPSISARQIGKVRRLFSLEDQQFSIPPSRKVLSLPDLNRGGSSLFWSAIVVLPPLLIGGLSKNKNKQTIYHSVTIKCRQSAGQSFKVAPTWIFNDTELRSFWACVDTNLNDDLFINLVPQKWLDGHLLRDSCDPRRKVYRWKRSHAFSRLMADWWHTSRWLVDDWNRFHWRFHNPL